MLSAMLVLVASCSKDNADVNAGPTGSENSITLTINTGDIQTRAMTVTETPGTGYENYIDINKLHVYFFDGNQDDNSSTYLLEFTPTEIVQSTTDGQLYTLTGTLKEAPKGEFKIVVLANWDETNAPSDLTAESTIDDLTIKSGAFDYNYDASSTGFTPSDTTPIPMYGVKTYDKIELDPMLSTDLGTINLVRGMAKIIVRSENSTISDVILTRCNDAGMSAPYSMYLNTTHTTDNNLNIPYEFSDYPDAAPSVIENLPFVNTGDQEYTIYIPEYQNIGSSRNGTVTPAKITLTIDNVEREIEFKDYSDNTPFNLLRNHIYEYIVETNSLKYVVRAWDEYIAGDIVFD
jgi:hypothetical protein